VQTTTTKKLIFKKSTYSSIYVYGSRKTNEVIKTNSSLCPLSSTTTKTRHDLKIHYRHPLSQELEKGVV